MNTKSAPVSQEEIRFLLKDFPCDTTPNEQESGFETQEYPLVVPRERMIKRESLARQIRRLFAASTAR